MVKNHLSIIFFVLCMLMVIVHLYDTIKIINNDMESKAEVIKGNVEYMEIEPSNVYKALWNIINIQFYLFVANLIYGKFREVS